MFPNATRMRYSTDCGIAALATAAGSPCHWLSAYGLLFGSHAPGDYYGVEVPAMCSAIKNLLGARSAMPSGAPLTSAKGPKGVVLCRVEHENAWTDGRHWLAWEKDEHGRVWLYNPTDGEVFRAESMTGRGFYQLCHFTIA